MPEVDTIIGADGHGRAAGGRRAVGAGHDLHGDEVTAVSCRLGGPPAPPGGLTRCRQDDGRHDAVRLGRLVHGQEVPCRGRPAPRGRPPSRPSGTRSRAGPVPTEPLACRRGPPPGRGRATPGPGSARRVGVSSRPAGRPRRPKDPIRVRRRFPQVGTTPERLPRSAASTRTYVPVEQSTSIRNTPGVSPGATSKRCTVTGRAARSTSMPSRASACRRRPPTLTAETIGGTCSMAPVARRPPPHVGQASRPPCPTCR